MKQATLAFIRFYQKHLSLDTGWARKFYLNDRVCRFTPTCSEYTYQAVDRYGILAGLWLGLKRIVRCNPWSAGGEDPVPRAI